MQSALPVRVVSSLSLALAVACSGTNDAPPAGAAGSAPDSNSPQRPVATSLLGEPLFAPPMDAAIEVRVEQARADHLARPDDAAALVWYGRLLGAAARYREARDLFEAGAKQFSDDPRMFRHLGHRNITLRELEAALRALNKAAELAKDRADEPEPPTKEGAATLDTLKQNIYYHLGLARYLLGDPQRAELAWRICLDFSANPDSQCSAAHWLYCSLRRQGNTKGAEDLLARFAPELQVAEYQAYRDAIRLYRGEIDGDAHFATLDPKGLDFATFGYGLGNWHFVNNRRDRALEVWRATAKAENWAAFGRIASEAELKRHGP